MAPEHRMEPSVFYNDNEPFIALWLAELAKGGHLPEGDLEIRSIKEIDPAVLRNYTHCHFFAGIGGWPLALAMAGWPRARPVWTMSCPCQPFSAAGKRLGAADERHLWPDALRLIAECRPPTIFGEQVASKDGRLWLAGVRADLEALGYAFGAADLCAAGVGAPHIRQRLFWVAHAPGTRQFAAREGAEAQAWDEARMRGFERGCAVSGVANADGGRESDGELQRSREHGQQPQGSGAVRVADTERNTGISWWTSAESSEGSGTAPTGPRPELGRRSGFITCLDGKARRVEPGIQPLAHGVPNRVGTLRGAGNAICPQIAAEFVAAYLDTERQHGVEAEP